MSKHAKPVLVRFWVGDTENIANTLVRDWEEDGHSAEFSVDDEIGKLVSKHMRNSSFRVTVQDASMIEWHVKAHSQSWSGTNHRVGVISRDLYIRQSVVPDWRYHELKQAGLK